MSLYQIFIELHKSWQAKDFDQARPMLTEVCEGAIALEDFYRQLLAKPQLTRDTIDLFQKTGLDQEPEDSAADIIFKRLIELAAGNLTPAPGETIH